MTTTNESLEKDNNVNPDKGQLVFRFIMCILAHVDHGKTSVADSLLAMAGIVHPNLVADTRYLDNREDEQAKGITMKSSVFSLKYQPSKEKYIFTVIDTPGHIDFSKEVSSVVKSCDGAVIIVDVVEGIRAQTREAIKIAMDGGLKMILLINKYDRLILNKKQSFGEACFSILRLLENTNEVLVEIFEERLKVQSKDDETRKNDAIIMAKSHLFAFEKDNVIIGCSLDGWGILPRDMLKLFLPDDDKIDLQSKKNLESKVMSHFCDPDYYYSSNHTVRQGAIKKGYDSMFMVMVVKTLNYVYDTLMSKKDIAEVAKITSRLKIKNITSGMRSSSSRIQLRAIMRTFAPLGETIMRASILVVPEARDVPLMRMRQMIREATYRTDENNLEQIAQMMNHLEFSRCHLSDSSSTSSQELATYAYISKLISVKKSDIIASDHMMEKLLKIVPITEDPAPAVAIDFIPEIDDLNPERNRNEMSEQPLGELRTVHAELPLSESAIQENAETVERCDDKTVDEVDKDQKRLETTTLTKKSENSATKRKIDATSAGPTDNSSEEIDEVSKTTAKSLQTTEECSEATDKSIRKSDKFVDREPKNFSSNLRNVSMGDEEPLVTIAIIRIFFGKIQMGDSVTLLQSAYKPPIKFDNKEKSKEYNAKYMLEFQIKEIYILNGRDIILTDKATAGCICGIRFDHTSKDGHLFRTGTIVNNIIFYPIYELPLLDPVLSVCVAPRFAKHMHLLAKGLTWLQNTDPSVKVRLQENGQYVILATGDVHMSKLSTDLVNYVKIELKFEDPIVSFRETVINTNEDDVGKTIAALQKLRHRGELKEFKFFIELHVMNLPNDISCFIEENIEILKLIEDTYDWGYIRKRFDIEAGVTMRKSVNKIYNTLQMERHSMLLQEKFKTIALSTTLRARNIWSVGHLGMPETSNLLINNVNHYKRSIFHTIDETDKRSLIDSCFVKAFNETIKAGPICGEPLANCGFVITDFDIDSYDAIMASDVAISTITSQITNACITAMKEAFLKQKVQLMEPMFETEISLMSSEQSESVMTIVKGRKGKVIEATDIPDEPSTFRAYIPALQCADFADAVRNITSGYANPYLRFKKFEIVDGDPLDDTGDEEQNPAYEFCTIVRKRKGLHAGDEVVEKGEKQKTLSKKK